MRASYISQFVAAAKAASPAVHDAEDDEGAAEEEQEKREVGPETEEMREAKRKVVKDLVASVRVLRIEASDKEFEGFANLVLSLILSLFASDHADFATLILAFVDTLALNGDRTTLPTLATRYSAISTVFNSLPVPTIPTDPEMPYNSIPATLRLAVLLKLITYASSHDDFSVIRPALDRLESWLTAWGFGLGTPGEEEGNAAVSHIVTSLLAKSHALEARSILLSHLSVPSVVEGSAVTPSRSAAKLSSQLIVLSLAQPDVFDFTTLSQLVAPSLPALAQLVTIFQTGDVAAFTSFAAAHGEVIKEQGLDVGALERKLKLLALAELCSKKVGEQVSYSEMAEALQMGSQADVSAFDEEVETWVIDGGSNLSSPHLSRIDVVNAAIRASLISGRLSQPLQSFQVTLAAPRTFTPSHWAALESRLRGWRSSLDAILESVGKGGGAGELASITV